MEEFSIITDTKDVQNVLLKRISAEVGNDTAVDIADNALRIKSETAEAKEKIIRAISDTIIEKYGSKLLHKLINQNYFYFTPTDRRIILKKAIDYADGGETYSDMVCGKLNEYLESTDRLLLDGFVNFRLRDYRDELEDTIDKAVDDFMIDKEYREFIRLLKHFVDIQEARYEMINVVPISGGGYLMYDGEQRDITVDCTKEFMREIDNDSINSDDLLISSLISIAPGGICIHKTELIKNKELIKTVEQVFGKKLTKCAGCLLCESR